MNAIEYTRQRVRANERTVTVYRPDSGRTYDGSLTSVGEIAVWIFDASATATVVTEGSEEDTSMTALLRPSQDLPSGVQVSDELRVTTDTEKRYEVRTKVGVPAALDPSIYRLGIERANDSRSP
jgi:hypothetical protein